MERQVYRESQNDARRRTDPRGLAQACENALEHVNPYTKKAWKDDNSIAALEYWNEFELGVVVYPAITQEGRDLIRKKFAAYLAKRFKNPREFLSYCEKIGKPWKVEGAFETFEEVDVSPYPNRAGNPVFARFIIEAMEDMQAFCEKVVREEIGMKVPTHQNNCIKNVYWTYLSSEGGSYTAVNTYHMHPSSYSLGANVPDKSSIENQGRLLAQHGRQKSRGNADCG